MTSQPSLPTDISDRDLLVELERAAALERQATARLIALLMEVDVRKLYAGQGYRLANGSLHLTAVSLL